jgi:hypothetical protein
MEIMTRRNGSYELFSGTVTAQTPGLHWRVAKDTPLYTPLLMLLLQLHALASKQHFSREMENATVIGCQVVASSIDADETRLTYTAYTRSRIPIAQKPKRYRRRSAMYTYTMIRNELQQWKMNMNRFLLLPEFSSRTCIIVVVTKGKDSAIHQTKVSVYDAGRHLAMRWCGKRFRHAASPRCLRISRRWSRNKAARNNSNSHRNARNSHRVTKSSTAWYSFQECIARE